MKMLNSTLVVFVFVLALGLVVSIPQVQSQQNKCSPIKQGLRFCTSARMISVPLGDKSIIKLSFENTTDETISLPTGDFSKYYVVRVTNSSNEEIPSLVESLKKKVDAGEVSNEEFVRQLPLNSGPRSFEINPGEKVTLEYDLSQSYSFNKAGIYHVMIERKLVDSGGRQTAISFGPIKIMVI
jgi:hypothetical protein